LVGEPQGSVSQPALFTSTIYPGRKFHYRVYVPAPYREGQPAALMVFQDGLNTYVDLLKTPWVFDRLIHDGQMPITIALFIDPGTPDGAFPDPNKPEWAMRSVQYDSVNETYARFLLDELLPEVVLRRYTITTDPDGWAIGGQSSGGIAAFTVAWHRPDRFHKVLTHNGSFVNIRGGNVYPSLVLSETPKPLRVYLLSSTSDLNISYGNWLQGNTALVAGLQTRGYAYRFRTGTGEHYPPVQALADYPDALRWLWNGYVLPR
jgi:enterochelin esterase family protein